MDRFSKLCLVLIVLLLFVIAMRPARAPFVSYAASAQYKYLGVGADWLEIQSILDKYAADGWELAGFSGVQNGLQGYVYLIFRK